MFKFNLLQGDCSEMEQNTQSKLAIKNVSELRKIALPVFTIPIYFQIIIPNQTLDWQSIKSF